MLVVHKIAFTLPKAGYYTMPEYYGRLKSSSIKGNILVIILWESMKEQTHMIKTTEFCGVVYYEDSAVMRFMHYGSVHVAFERNKAVSDTFAKVVKDLFNPPPKDTGGELIDLLAA